MIVGFGNRAQACGMDTPSTVRNKLSTLSTKVLSYLMNCLDYIQAFQHHAIQQHHVTLHSDQVFFISTFKYSLPLFIALFVALVTFNDCYIR